MGSGLAVFAGQVIRIHESVCTMGTDQAPRPPPKGRTRPWQRGATALQVLVLMGVPRWWASPGPASLPRCLPVLPSAL